jgi:hypothetical protein
MLIVGRRTPIRALHQQIISDSRATTGRQTRQTGIQTRAEWLINLYGSSMRLCG